MKKISILSLSLLTVMAGAAVAPALGVIREYFSDAGALMIQLIISMPAVFIFLTSFIFPKLTGIFRVKTLVVIGLSFYLLGGCLAGLSGNIWTLFLFRALVGIGVGILMPLSTGLLSFYYPPEQLDGLMGLSSAMNQMGGVIATLIAGVLAAVSWRASFLVYLLGTISLILCLFFLPNDKLRGSGAPGENCGGSSDGTLPKGGSSTKRSTDTEADEIRKRHPFLRYYTYIISMFLLMMIFFLYPANFAIETARDHFLRLSKGRQSGCFNSYAPAYRRHLLRSVPDSLCHVNDQLAEFITSALLVRGGAFAPSGIMDPAGLWKQEHAITAYFVKLGSSSPFHPKRMMETMMDASMTSSFSTPP